MNIFQYFTNNRYSRFRKSLSARKRLYLDLATVGALCGTIVWLIKGSNSATLTSSGSNIHSGVAASLLQTETLPELGVSSSLVQAKRASHANFYVRGMSLAKNYSPYLVLGAMGGIFLASCIDLSVVVLRRINNRLQDEDPLDRELHLFRQEIKEFRENLRQRSQQSRYKSEKAFQIDGLLQNTNDTIRLLLEEKLDDKYICPITKEIIREPIRQADGRYYERLALQSWYERGNRKCLFDTSKELVEPNSLPIADDIQTEIFNEITNVIRQPQNSLVGSETRNVNNGFATAREERMQSVSAVPAVTYRKSC